MHSSVGYEVFVLMAGKDLEPIKDLVAMRRSLLYRARILHIPNQSICNELEGDPALPLTHTKQKAEENPRLFVWCG